MGRIRSEARSSGRMLNEPAAPCADNFSQPPVLRWVGVGVALCPAFKDGPLFRASWFLLSLCPSRPFVGGVASQGFMKLAPKENAAEKAHPVLGHPRHFAEPGHVERDVAAIASSRLSYLRHRRPDCAPS